MWDGARGRANVCLGRMFPCFNNLTADRQGPAGCAPGVADWRRVAPDEAERSWGLRLVRVQNDEKEDYEMTRMLYMTTAAVALSATAALAQGASDGADAVLVPGNDPAAAAAALNDSATGATTTETGQTDAEMASDSAGKPADGSDTRTDASDVAATGTETDTARPDAIRTGTGTDMASDDASQPAESDMQNDDMAATGADSGADETEIMPSDTDTASDTVTPTESDSDVAATDAQSTPDAGQTAPADQAVADENAVPSAETGEETVAATDTGPGETGNPDMEIYQAMTVNDLLGIPVLGSEDQRVGEIDYLVASNDTVNAIVGVGGFLGLGEHTVSIPLSEMQFTDDRELSVNLTGEQLRDMPEIDESEIDALPGDAMILDSI